MNTTYEAVRPLEDGKPVPVLERDENGSLVGAWIGYWSHKRETVALYPDVKNKFANWPGGIKPSSRRLVSDRRVRVRRQASESIPRPSATPLAGEGLSGRTDRKAPIEGQEKIRF